MYLAILHYDFKLMVTQKIIVKILLASKYETKKQLKSHIILKEINKIVTLRGKKIKKQLHARRK